jgi:hypothetical protein
VSPDKNVVRIWSGREHRELSLQDLTALIEADPQAKALGYVHDATKVDAKANPNYKAGQKCTNCLQAPKAKEGDAWVGCNIFGGREVAGPGWCKVYVKRP